MNDLLDDLNPEQRDAVTHVDGPLLILAGAGSGKTRVITRRIAWLVRRAGVDPSEILAVTFTNKAAGEMRERVRCLLGAPAGLISISTFHSAGLGLLREHGEHIGVPRNLLVYDDSDQLSLITRTIKESGIDATLFPPRAIRSRIDYAKSCGLGPEEMEVSHSDLTGDKARQVYRMYQSALRAAGAVDFGDLILSTVELLREHPLVLKRLRERWRYLMVDEFQDTSPVQYELVRLLTGDRGNLVVVGDDDQSIYRWRGADVRNILSFETDYPHAKVVKLEQNYRSTPVILDAAHAVIRRSKGRREKKLFTENVGGDLLRVLAASDEVEEARLVVEQIQAAIRDGFSRREIAVFYRVNAMSRVIEDALRASRMPYQVVRGRSFYDRAEIKDLTAYLRLAVNPRSDADLLRVINTPRRGIGARTIERLRQLAREAGTSLWEVVSDGLNLSSLGGRAERGVRPFVELIRRLNDMVEEGRSTHQVLEEALTGSGLVAALQAEETAEANERLENLTELLAAALQRDPEHDSVVVFLDEVALVGDADFELDPDRVSLMTLHAAKGLEFDLAVVVGMEERTLPHARAFGDSTWSEDPEEMAEERRLCYVGFTRARRRLVLGFARSRWVMGARQVKSASRFLEEIPPELIEGGGWLDWSGGRSYGSDSVGLFDDRERWRPHRRQSRDDLSCPAEGELVIDYGCDQRPLGERAPGPRAGGRVRHRSFGEGEIRHVDGYGSDARLVVVFEDAGVKKILARYLEVL